MLLPAGEPKDGSNCVTALFGKAACLVAACLLLGQCLNDGSEVLASVGLKAEAECDRGDLETKLPSKLLLSTGFWWTFLTREVPLPWYAVLIG